MNYWIFILFFGHFSLMAQEFTFDHEDCRIRMKTPNTKRLKQAKALLKERKFNVLELLDNKRVFPGELYFALKIERPEKKLYTDCVVTLKIQKAKGNIPRLKDDTLFKKRLTRRVPRITFKGEERCRMALKDAFIHIPTCKKRQ